MLAVLLRVLGGQDYCVKQARSQPADPPTPASVAALQARVDQLERSAQAARTRTRLAEYQRKMRAHDPTTPEGYSRAIRNATHLGLQVIAALLVAIVLVALARAFL